MLNSNQVSQNIKHIRKTGRGDIALLLCNFILTNEHSGISTVIKFVNKSCVKHTTAPFLIRYPSLMGFIVLVAPADPERFSESVD